MPNTRKKVIKTVFKDEDDSAEETGDFSDSGSEAVITEDSSSDNDEEDEEVASSGDDFKNIRNKSSKQRPLKKPKKFAKTFINKISKQSFVGAENEDCDVSVTPFFSVKDLTDADKLLPSILNLSESDSSEDESPNQSNKNTMSTSVFSQNHKHDTDDEAKPEYKDVWSQNMQEESEEIARKAFLELEKHKSKIEETKAQISNYSMKQQTENEFNVQDLLAQGEVVMPQSETPAKKKRKAKTIKDESDSDLDDFEEVEESKAIPQQGLQLVVKLPDSICRKTKKVDVEMMMKRKMNRVKKEYQVYMHKVHVLCWIGHGNHVSKVLNDQEVLAATLSLVPSKECYPGERVDMKYLEQITSWYKDKLTLKQDKNENKFRPKAPPLKELLLGQIKNRVVTTKKYLVFIFVAMLRALGLQCRVMFNFVTLPIKPPISELCSLSTKPKEDSGVSKQKPKASSKGKESKQATKSHSKKSKHQDKIPQLDGNDDNIISTFDNIMQLDGNDDTLPTRSTRSRKAKAESKNASGDDVSPPKRSRKSPTPKPSKPASKTNKAQVKSESSEDSQISKISNNPPATSSRKTRSANNSINVSKVDNVESQKKNVKKQPKLAPPKIVVTKADQDKKEQSSKYFSNKKNSDEEIKIRPSRKRAITANPDVSQDTEKKEKPIKSRTKSAPGHAIEKSKYFDSDTVSTNQNKKCRLSLRSNKASETKTEDQQRISHRELNKQRAKPKNDVKDDLINIIKGRVKESKEQSKKGKVKGKSKLESDEDSDFLPEESNTHGKSDSDDEFKPTPKISPRPKPSSSKKIDRRVVSSDSDTPTNKIDVWCEVFVEELEQWISVNVVKGKVHCTESIYTGATHPVCYIVGWDNNNYLKDLTRRYVPHWNTVTRKQRAEPVWWSSAIRPWLGPSTARDKEENEQLDRMQMDAPLPKSIGEYKNHPLYALKRHLLKFEALYPPDAPSLGFVRGEAVYARDCVHVCCSREKWLLTEAKVVRMGEKPYKVVKARPKWDRLSNKLITDKPLEIFGPWQVQDYEPPTAENGIVPRNAYGNVELFKMSMLPKGTVHIKLPGLNKVAKKLNIDCAPAMTGFDYTGGWTHPAYDGFVVCKEFEDIIKEAWVEDQEDQERKEQEKTESRIYGHWRRLIKGLLIRERLKNKYGFQGPSTSKDNKKNTTGPRLVVKKK